MPAPVQLAAPLAQQLGRGSLLQRALPPAAKAGAMITLAWLRQDLRLADQAVLRHAISLGQPLLVLHVLPRQWLQADASGMDRLGSAKAAFLLQCLEQLSENLAQHDIPLASVVGDPVNLIQRLADQLPVTLVTAVAQAPEERAWLERLQTLGIQVITAQTQTLFSDAPVAMDSTRFPATFNRFRRQVEKSGVQPPQPVAAASHWPAGAALPEALTQMPDAITLLAERAARQPRARYPARGGEHHAAQRLAAYLAEQEPLASYKRTRNQLQGANFSSRLSADLATGALSARQAWHAILDWEQQHQPCAGSQWLRMELLWREFFHWSMRCHGKQLFRYDALTGKQPYHGQVTSKQRLYWSRWCQASTGLPCIDAPLRELTTHGWLSNRARQLLASFLVHDMGLDWRLGAAFFQHYLVDDDVASNWGNWGYIAGVGHDAQGGRRFAALEQTRRHDPMAHHIRTWLPELAELDNDSLWALHRQPANSPPSYPSPMLPVVGGLGQ